MNKILIEKEALVSQSVKSVVELLNYIGKFADPLPEVVEFPGLVLVQSRKKDAYYTTTALSCSCPSANYRPGQICKHRRTYFSDVEKAERIAEAKAKTEVSRQQTRDYQDRQRAIMAEERRSPRPIEETTAKRIAKPPEDSIRPAGKWPGGFNGPVDLEDVKSKTILDEGA